MQSTILVAIMVLVSIFMAAEMSRNKSSESNAVSKSQNVAANILQYQDLVVQYMLANYSRLHSDFSNKPDYVEQVEILDYDAENIDMYSQKSFKPFLNYSSVFFNYAKNIPNETKIPNILYVATSFDSYPDSNIRKTYSNTKFPEVMGYLGESLSKHLYQGNSTYWTVPWLFRQKNCNVIEVYSQIPNEAETGKGVTNYEQVQALFKQFCNQIQLSGYTFLSYVYMQPVFNPANI